MKSSALVLAILLVLAAGPAIAQQGEWSVGYRLLGASTDLVSEDVGTTHSGLMLDSGFGLGADLSYLVTDRFGIEASLAASYHEMSLEGDLLDGEDAGDEWLMPLSVTLVYHLPMLGHVQPYLGVGVGYVAFLGYSESAELAAIGVDDIDTDGSFDLVAQAGLDYEMSDRWSAVLDVKYTELSSDMEVDLGGGQTYATVPVDGELWQVGLGVEYRFGYRY